MAVKHKVDDLDGRLLDKAVDLALGVTPRGVPWSSEWGNGGQLIEPFFIQLAYCESTSIEGGKPFPWYACIGADISLVRDAGWTPKGEGYGYTPLVAAMRALVSSKFGAEVDL